MPTYAYRCTECDHAFDVHQSFSDDALTVCPECGGKLRKVFGNLGVTFKGSGFYRTDSRSGGSSSGGSSSGGSGGAASGSGAAASSSGGSSSATTSSAGSSSSSASTSTGSSAS